MTQYWWEGHGGGGVWFFSYRFNRRQGNGNANQVCSSLF